MDRLKLYVVNHVGGTDFVGSTYIDIQSMMDFFRRQRRINHFSIIATKGKKALHLEKIDPATLVKDLTTFANEQ